MSAVACAYGCLDARREDLELRLIPEERCKGPCGTRADIRSWAWDGFAFLAKHPSRAYDVPESGKGRAWKGYLLVA